MKSDVFLNPAMKGFKDLQIILKWGSLTKDEMVESMIKLKFDDLNLNVL